MRSKIDLEAAAQAESSGAFAVGRREFRRGRSVVAKGRAGATVAAELARHLLGLVREAGGKKSWVKSGKVSLHLEEKGESHVLTIRGC